MLAVEAGNVGIKANRAKRAVPVPPGGVVADYVPFYFAPRSPMMYSIHMGNVPTYQDGIGRFVYLVTTVERLLSGGRSVVLSDRNAVLDYAEFWALDDGEPEADFIDWPLMEQRMWNETREYPDRRERRMAECLVHQSVPFELFTGVAAMSSDVADEVRAILRAAGAATTADVTRDWYF